MAGEDIIQMTGKELKRIHMIRKVVNKELTQREGSEGIGVSERQIRRMVKRVKVEGDSGVCHRLRGKESNRRIPNKLKDCALKFYRKSYKDFGPTLAVEKLKERDGINLSRETLRKWLIVQGAEYARRKNRPHRQWRERKAHFGEMIQMDGSHHDWFEGRGPRCVLMGYVDDATGCVYARFFEYEGTLPAMAGFLGYIRAFGLPGSVYLDRHTTYKSPAKQTLEQQLQDVKPLSQFERALQELGVRVIHAYSPKAKGRIERLFKTFQDRVIKEMRLKKVSTIEEGNRFLEPYLPVFNKKYSVKAAKEVNLHQPAPPMKQLKQILCIKEERILRNDFTISYNNQWYQITENIRAKKVIVEERLDGSIHLSHQEKSLTFEEITTLPVKTHPTQKVIKTKKTKRPSPFNFFNQCSRDKRTKTMATTLT